MPSASSQPVRYSRLVDRLQRLTQRLVEEDVPFQPRNLRPGGQDRTSVEVLSEGGRLGLRVDHGGHLRKLREIAPQTALGVRVGEQPAGWPDHVGFVTLADLNLVHEDRQELEVDLGDGRTGVLTGMRHRDRHERVEPVKVDR